MAKNNNPDAFLFNDITIGRVYFKVVTTPNLTLPDKKTQVKSWTDHNACVIYVEANIADAMKHVYFWKEILGVMAAQTGQYTQPGIEPIITMFSFQLHQLVKDNEIDRVS